MECFPRSSSKAASDPKSTRNSQMICSLTGVRDQSIMFRAAFARDRNRPF
jgi:hypothetical protein